MTKGELSAARSTLGMTQAALAAVLRSDIRTVRRWERGERQIPGPVSVAIEMLLAEAGR